MPRGGRAGYRNEKCALAVPGFAELVFFRGRASAQCRSAFRGPRARNSITRREAGIGAQWARAAASFVLNPIRVQSILRGGRLNVTVAAIGGLSYASGNAFYRSPDHISGLPDLLYCRRNKG